MAFPSKNTHAIRVDNSEYLWHLNRDWEVKKSWITIAQKDFESNQLLLLDPYHHDILPTKKTIIAAIKFGIQHGWNPLMKGPSIRIAWNGQTFEALPTEMRDWEHHQQKKYLK